MPEIEIDRAKVYPTQPFEVTLRVLVRPLPDDPRSRSSDAASPAAAASGRQLGRTSRRGSRLKKKCAGSKNFSPKTEPALRSTTSPCAAARFSTVHGPPCSICTRVARPQGAGWSADQLLRLRAETDFTPEKAGNYQFGPGGREGDIR